MPRVYKKIKQKMSNNCMNKSTHSTHECKGQTCLRCWHNKLKHANKETKKHLSKLCAEGEIESVNAVGNYDVTGERKQTLSRWEKDALKRKEEEATPEYQEQQLDLKFIKFMEQMQKIERQHKQFEEKKKEKKKEEEGEKMSLEQIMQECKNSY